jgi:hypothetical protein
MTVGTRDTSVAEINVSSSCSFRMISLKESAARGQNYSNSNRYAEFEQMHAEAHPSKNYSRNGYKLTRKKYEER